MEQTLKQRLVGATVLIALAVIFLPVFISGPDEAENRQPDDFYIPAEPQSAQVDGPTRRLPVLPSSGQLTLPDSQPSVPSVERIMPLPEAATGSDSDHSATATSGQSVETTTVQEPQTLDDLVAAVDPQVDTPSASINREDDLAAARDSLSDAEDAAAGQLTGTATAPAATATASISDTRPTDIAISSNDWRVQVVTLGSPDNVSRLRQQLSAAGITNSQERIERGSQVLYRILTGPYATRAGAQAAIGDIQSLDNRLQPQVLAPTADDGAALPTEVATATNNLQRFAVQAGVFSESANAQSVVERLTSAGYAAYAEQVSNSGNTLYRVRIGPLLTQADADEMVSRIQGSLNIQGIVVAYP